MIDIILPFSVISIPLGDYSYQIGKDYNATKRRGGQGNMIMAHKGPHKGGRHPLNIITGEML